MRAGFACLVGVSAGCLAAWATHTVAGATPGALGGIVIVLVLGMGAAATSLASWHHRPGLPAFAAAAALVCVGWRRTVPPSELWLTWIVDTLWVMGGFLVAYAAAWAVDTQIVFRALPQRPPPKEATPRLLLTRFLPCCLLTGAGGAMVLGWGASGRHVNAGLVALAFGLGAAVAVRVFPTVSTIWVTFGGLWAAGMVGLVGLSEPGPALGGARSAAWRGWNAHLFVSVAVCSALVGSWLARLRR